MLRDRERERGREGLNRNHGGEVAGLVGAFILRLCVHSNKCTYLARKLIWGALGWGQLVDMMGLEAKSLLNHHCCIQQALHDAGRFEFKGKQT